MVDYTMTNAIMGERPKFNLPNPKFLEQVTQEGFKKLINDFYEEVIDSEIAYFFPTDDDELEKVKIKNGMYFMMMCGGSKDYLTKMNGEKDQVKFHDNNFSIPHKARYEWLGCWEIVLRPLEKTIEHDLIQSYWNWIEVFSKHIVNFENDRQTLEDKVNLNK